MVGYQVQQGISRRPPGDQITVNIANRHLPELMRVLYKMEVGRSLGSSITVSEPKALISSGSTARMSNDTSDVSWEEMETMMAKESNMNLDMLLVMFISGILATAGVITNSIHYVIASMVIAPGFEPITRVGIGLISGSDGWKRGIRDTILGYGSLITGAALTTLLLSGTGYPLIGNSGYLSSGSLLVFWTTVTFSSVLVSLGASIAGALLIHSDRTVLTSGVMIALSLIPTAAVFGLSLVTRDFSSAANSILRWGIDVVIVMAGALFVSYLKSRFLLKRKTML